MKFIFIGAGYCSEFIIPLISKKFEIIGIHKSLPFNFRFKNFKNVKRYDLKSFLNKSKKILEDTTHILVSVPPDINGDFILKKITPYLNINESLQWIGYFSSTGVYGDYKGQWVNEKSELKTNNLRSINRIKAEKQYMQLYNDNNAPIHIFRLPGIYGPKRSVFDKLKQNEVLIIRKANHFFSRIHVQDIATAILKSIVKPSPGEIFNISDDYPCASEKVMRYACKITGIKGLKAIEFDDDSVSEMTRSFYRENKRVSNKKIKKYFNWKPSFRTYKEGLKNIYNFENKNLLSALK